LFLLMIRSAILLPVGLVRMTKNVCMLVYELDSTINTKYG
jgi:hypothetical protein